MRKKLAMPMRRVKMPSSKNRYRQPVVHPASSALPSIGSMSASRLTGVAADAAHLQNTGRHEGGDNIGEVVGHPEPRKPNGYYD